MTESSAQRYSPKPIDLPLDDWLYACVPRPGCDICASLEKELKEARDKRNWSKAWEVRREIESGHTAAGRHAKRKNKEETKADK